jgi:hypothetical protein
MAHRPILRSHPLFVILNGALLGIEAVTLLLYAAHVGEFILLVLTLMLTSSIGVLTNVCFALYACIVDRRFPKAGACLVAVMIWAILFRWVGHWPMAIGGEYKPKYHSPIQH